MAFGLVRSRSLPTGQPASAAAAATLATVQAINGHIRRDLRLCRKWAPGTSGTLRAACRSLHSASQHQQAQPRIAELALPPRLCPLHCPVPFAAAGPPRLQWTEPAHTRPGWSGHQSSAHTWCRDRLQHAGRAMASTQPYVTALFGRRQGGMAPQGRQRYQGRSGWPLSACPASEAQSRLQKRFAEQRQGCKLTEQQEGGLDGPQSPRALAPACHTMHSAQELVGSSGTLIKVVRTTGEPGFRRGWGAACGVPSTC